MKIILLFLVLVLAACGANVQIANTQNVTNTNSDQEVAAQPTPTPTTESKPVDYFAHMRPEHRKVLQQWLRTKPNLRPAVEEIDSYLFNQKDGQSIEESKESLSETIGNDGNQYYAVGDMNRDGKQDFAVLLIDTSKKNGDSDVFGLAIFNAPFSPGSAPAYYENKLQSSSSSYISFDGPNAKNRLFLGKIESDMICATYYPKGRTYFFKDCEF